MNCGWTVYSVIIPPSFEVIRSLQFQQTPCFARNLSKLQTSFELNLGEFICRMHLSSMVYALYTTCKQKWTCACYTLYVPHKHASILCRSVPRFNTFHNSDYCLVITTCTCMLTIFVTMVTLFIPPIRWPRWQLHVWWIQSVRNFLCG